MLAGTKPLAVFVEEPGAEGNERILPERAFAPYVAEGRFVMRVHPERYTIKGRTLRFRRFLYALAAERWRIDAYLLLHASVAKSGLIPFFANGEPPKYSTINARIETA